MSDVSNKTIFALVILTLVISVISTAMLIANSGDQIGAPVSQASPTDTAKISYKIARPQKTMGEATGKIAFAIENKINS